MWARTGPIADLLATAIRPIAPSLLVVSLPRSGSSWIGATLGLSSGAMYLREPVSQSHLLRHKQRGVVFKVEPSGLPGGYRRFADRAFRGVPRFAANVVKWPGQWGLGGRSRRRLVVKEVNPMALDWLLGRYRPRLIYLVRHPAAVAASFSRLGWMSATRESEQRRFSAQRIGFDPDEVAPHRSRWGEHAALQGLIMRTALESASRYGDHMVVRYEQLCEDPLNEFRRLYDFAGLAWDERVAESIRAQTSVEDHNRYESYSLYRNSRTMSGSWRSDVEPIALADMKAAFLSYGLPYYGQDEW